MHFWLTAVSGIGLAHRPVFPARRQRGDGAAGRPSLDGLLRRDAAVRLHRAPGHVSATDSRLCGRLRPRPAGLLKNIGAVKRLVKLYEVFTMRHPVIWILTEWLEPLCLTPPC